MDHELIVIFLERRTCFCTWTSSSSKSSYATNVTLEQQERSSTCSELTMADFLHSLNISPFNQPIQHTKQGFCLMRQICKILLNLVPMNLRFAFISNGNLIHRSKFTVVETEDHVSLVPVLNHSCRPSDSEVKCDFFSQQIHFSGCIESGEKLCQLLWALRCLLVLRPTSKGLRGIQVTGVPESTLS